MWSLGEAQEFFYQRAAFACPVGAEPEEIEECQRSNAARLAHAEQALREGPYFVDLEPDPEPWDGDVPYDGPLWGVLLMRVDEGDRAQGVASLWQVGATGHLDPYVRVVAAELMAEHLSSREVR